MQFMTVYLNFDGNALEAFEFYRSVFGGEFDGILRFRDFGEDAMGVPESDFDKIAHISLPITNGVGLMASDVAGQQSQDFRAGNNFYIYLEADYRSRGRPPVRGSLGGRHRGDGAAAHRVGREVHQPHRSVWCAVDHLVHGRRRLPDVADSLLDVGTRQLGARAPARLDAPVVHERRNRAARPGRPLLQRCPRCRTPHLRATRPSPSPARAPGSKRRGRGR